MERSTRRRHYSEQPRPNIIGLILFYGMCLTVALAVGSMAALTIAERLGYHLPQLVPAAQTFATPAQAAPAAAPRASDPATVQSPQNDAAPAVAAPVRPQPDPQLAADQAAAQQSQPDDYTELTKPSTRTLPTIEPEVKVQQQTAPVSSAATNEGSKPARHRP